MGALDIDFVRRIQCFVEVIKYLWPDTVDAFAVCSGLFLFFLTEPQEIVVSILAIQFGRSADSERIRGYGPIFEPG